VLSPVSASSTEEISPRALTYPNTTDLPVEFRRGAPGCICKTLNQNPNHTPMMAFPIPVMAGHALPILGEAALLLIPDPSLTLRHILADQCLYDTHTITSRGPRH